MGARMSDEIVVASVPAGHVYLRHIAAEQETSVRRLPDPDPDDPRRSAEQGWWPPVMLDPAWIERADFDVFHLQFGFDAWSPEQLADVVAAIRRKGGRSSTPCTTCATPTTRTGARTTPSSTCSCLPPTRS